MALILFHVSVREDTAKPLHRNGSVNRGSKGHLLRLFAVLFALQCFFPLCHVMFFALCFVFALITVFFSLPCVISCFYRVTLC
jgi:hypothetical protein